MSNDNHQTTSSSEIFALSIIRTAIANAVACGTIDIHVAQSMLDILDAFKVCKKHGHAWDTTAWGTGPTLCTWCKVKKEVF